MAGASAPLVVGLAASMLLLQLAIGATNDWADAAADAEVRPTKPIPAGLVARDTVALAAGVLAAAGVGLAALAGTAALATALVGLSAGIAYDLRLKGTRWSWVPYTVGIPLVPVFAWVGAAGRLPGAFFALIPAAVLAGIALAVANALADVERDVRASTETVATSLGIRASRRLGAILEAMVVVIALGSAALLGGSPSGIWIAGAGAAVIVAGVAMGWGSSASARQRAWELQGVGLGVLAAGWTLSLVAAGRLAS